jgi:hypothetical protein
MVDVISGQLIGVTANYKHNTHLGGKRHPSFDSCKLYNVDNKLELVITGIRTQSMIGITNEFFWALSNQLPLLIIGTFKRAEQNMLTKFKKDKYERLSDEKSWIEDSW